MSFRTSLFLIVNLLIVCASCTIVKRSHLPGYYIERMHRNRVAEGQEQKAAFRTNAPESSRTAENTKPSELPEHASDSVHGPEEKALKPETGLIDEPAGASPIPKESVSIS